MGMYDEIVFREEEAPKCVEGFPSVYLQTKSLPCNLDRYYVIHGQLYIINKDKSNGYSRDVGLEAYTKWEVNTDTKDLELVSVRVASPHPFTGTIVAYGGNNCKPVYIINPNPAFYGEMLEEKRPGITYELEFKDGLLQSCTQVNPLTRQQLREKLEKQGCIVLDDDNAIVVAHEMKKQGKYT